MSYSDYDSDGYSSHDDADYVPSADNLSEDDMNECVKEDPLNENDGVPDAADKKMKMKKLTKKKKEGGGLGMRKRKKGVLKVEEDQEKKEGENDEGTVANEKEEEEEEEEEKEEPGEAVGRSEDVKQKKKADDLWASFLSDVGTRPKQSPTPAESSSTEKAQPPSPKNPSVSVATKAPEAAKPAAASTITITKVFDFAGEEVRVTKEVAVDSREARGFLKTQGSQQEQQQQNKTSPSSGGLPGPSVKRPAGMSSILGQMGGKKQKMSTLEKSKMDWDCFKSEEGITEELAIHNRGKEGYVERKNFLERVDHRQFEREKEVRLTNMKR